MKKNKLPLVVASVVGAIFGGGTMLGGYFYMSNQRVTGVADKATVTVSAAPSDDVTAMIQQVSPSVVGIISFEKNVDDVLESLLGETEGNRATPRASVGSGFIYKNEGGRAFIATNHHVIEGGQRFEVSLYNGTLVDAKVVGSDRWLDLAVLEIDGREIEGVATLGNSDTTLAGQPVVAIGDSLGFLPGSVTMGIISSQERLIPVEMNNDGVSDWEAIVMQTDAAINPGNSGGPLLNLSGEVIGINSSKLSGGAIEGIGFAIPINSAMPILEQLEEYGEISRAQIGAQFVELLEVPERNREQILQLPNSVTKGLVIVSINRASAASTAGLQLHDVIVEIDQIPMGNILELRKYLFDEKQVGDTISVTFYRQGKRKTIELVLEKIGQG